MTIIRNNLRIAKTNIPCLKVLHLKDNKLYSPVFEFEFVPFHRYRAQYNDQIHPGYIKSMLDQKGEFVIESGFFHSVYYDSKIIPKILDSYPKLWVRRGAKLCLYLCEIPEGAYYQVGKGLSGTSLDEYPNLISNRIIVCYEVTRCVQD